MYGNSVGVQERKHASVSVSYSPQEDPYGRHAHVRSHVSHLTGQDGNPPRPASIAGGARSRWDCWDVLGQPDHPLARPFDVILAAAMIVAFLPLFIGITVAIWLNDRGPVLFVQRRVGRNGRCFPCLKFRSMRIDAQQVLAAILRDDPVLRAQWERDHKLPSDPRVTSIGRILRVTSLDELPQLFNVLRGEMSIVGPRPIVIAEIPRYGRYIHHYYAVRPGLTGLWQVSGRSSVTYRRRVAADIKYTRARTLVFDARILAATIPAVATGRGSC